MTASTTPVSPVRSYTEWDPLEEIVVGQMSGGVFPTWQASMAETMPPGSWRTFIEQGGKPFPREQVDAAQRELDDFAELLTRRGITVTRPDAIDHAIPYRTRHWESKGGLYSAMPRDYLLVVGENIIEAPMSWRSRAYEGDAYRELLKDYFRRGGGWLQAPKPQLTDELFHSVEFPNSGDWGVTEFEPVFDAAEFMRLGRDIVVQKSHVTNEFGIQWLQRAIGDEYTIHVLPMNDPKAMHIDSTTIALAPGVLLVQPDRYIPSPLFQDWKIIDAPKSTLTSDWPLYFCSTWVNMNVLSLDPQTVVVEKHETPLIDTLKENGFDVVPVSFRNVFTFGGGFHCVTADVRRSGENARYVNV